MPVTLHPKDAGLALQRTVGKKKKPSKKATKPEAQLQQECEAILEACGIVFLHIPAYLLNAGFRDGASSGPAMWAMRNAAKDVRGFPDLCVFHPDGLHFLCVELKTEVGRLTPSQEMWRRAVDGCVVRSVPEFDALLRSWIANPLISKTILMEKLLTIRP